MTKRTTTGALLVIGALVAAACGDGVLPSGPDFDAQFRQDRGKEDKIDVCHNGKMISVNANSAHVGHGDLVGSCDEPDPDPTPDPTPDPPTITVSNASFTELLIGELLIGVFLAVEFNSADCAAPWVYQVVGVDDASVVVGTPLSGNIDSNGPFMISGLIQLADIAKNSAYQVLGDCDDGNANAVSADITNP